MMRRCASAVVCRRSIASVAKRPRCRSRSSSSCRRCRCRSSSARRRAECRACRTRARWRACRRRRCTTSASSPILWNISTHAIRVVAGAFGRRDRIGERIAAVDGAEDRAAEPQDAGDVARRQRTRAAGFDQAVEAVLEADALDAAVAGGLDDGADDRVEAGSVAAAGENTDAFDGWHCRSTIANGPRGTLPRAETRVLHFGVTRSHGPASAFRVGG